MDDRIGIASGGLWPSEGSVSDEVLHLAAELGSNGLRPITACSAARSAQDPGPSVTYRPYLWKQGEHQMHGIFRDHFLSDLIGFVYARMGAERGGRALPGPHPRELPADPAQRPRRAGADHSRWRKCLGILRAQRPAVSARVVPADHEDRDMSAVTVTEALCSACKRRSSHGIFPGSWINANFDVWIGAEEDNKAWEYLLRARQTYERCHSFAGGSGDTGRAQAARV